MVEIYHSYSTVGWEQETTREVELALCGGSVYVGTRIWLPIRNTQAHYASRGYQRLA